MNEVWQDRIPPQNIEAEQAVLGSVFLTQKRSLMPWST